MHRGAQQVSIASRAQFIDLATATARVHCIVAAAQRSGGSGLPALGAQQRHLHRQRAALTLLVNRRRVRLNVPTERFEAASLKRPQGVCTSTVRAAIMLKRFVTL